MHRLGPALDPVPIVVSRSCFAPLGRGIFRRCALGVRVGVFPPWFGMDVRLRAGGAGDARRRRHLRRRPGLSIPAHHGVPSHPALGRAGVRCSPCLVHRQSRRGGRPGSQRLASLRRPAGGLSRAAVVRERWVFVAGIACCAPYLLNAQAHQQVDIIIAALMVAGCLELTRGATSPGRCSSAFPRRSRARR